VDLGLGFATSHSEVLDLGGNEPFNALSGRIIEGQPVPVAWGRRVANPDVIGEWEYASVGDSVIGPKFPRHFVTPSVTLRAPFGITLAARGEYRGGHYVDINPIPIGRSVRSPLCYPYYVDPENSIELEDDIPALWRERCTPGAARDYWFDGDYFKLRTVTAAVPVDFAFPQVVSNALITVTLANSFDWYREVPWYDVELTSDAGSGQSGEGFANAAERTPAPATLRIALRVTF
jgi:hypothetical protein